MISAWVIYPCTLSGRVCRNTHLGGRGRRPLSLVLISTYNNSFSVDSWPQTIDQHHTIEYNRGMKRLDSLTTAYLTWSEVPLLERRKAGDEYWSMTTNPFLEGTDYHGLFEDENCSECRGNLVRGMGTSHESSIFCRSGGRSHCSCRACF